MIVKLSGYRMLMLTTIKYILEIIVEIILFVLCIMELTFEAKQTCSSSVLFLAEISLILIKDNCTLKPLSATKHPRSGLHRP